MKVTIISVLSALLTLGLSFAWSINLVWAACLALFAADDEVTAVGVGVLGGFIYDALLHSGFGVSSFAAAFALFVFLLLKSFRFGQQLWQTILIFILLNFVALSVSHGLEIILDGGAFNSAELLFWVRISLYNTLLTLPIWGGINLWRSRNPEERAVKI